MATKGEVTWHCNQVLWGHFFRALVNSQTAFDLKVRSLSR